MFYDPEAELVEIAADFRHVREESKREREKGTTRRRQHAKMEELERRFETLLGRWVPDDGTRDRWRAHLHEGADAPAAPGPPRALVFRGRADSGATATVFEAPDGTQEVLVDGRPAPRFHGRVELDERPRPVQLLGRSFEESAEAPEEAVAAMRAFFERPEGEPPWEWARALLDDGLIDRDFSLTTRGRRFLAARA